MLYKMLTNCKISCKQQTSSQIEEICSYETFTFRRRAYSHLRKTERRNGLSGPHRTSNSFLLEMSMTIPCVSVCSKYKEKRELNCRTNIAWSILDPSAWLLVVSSMNAPYMYIHVILVCDGRLVLQIEFVIHEKNMYNYQL